MTSCDEITQLLHPLLDDELPPDEAGMVRMHLATCTACRAELGELESLRAAIQTMGPHPLPVGFTERLRHELPTTGKPRAAATRRYLGPIIAGTTAGLVASLLVLAWPAPLTLLGPDVAPLVDAHVRSLQADHLVDIASSETHVLRPWFAGRIDLAPRLPDLGQHGFEMIGARLDYIDGSPAAAIVLKRRRHVVNLLVRRGPAADTVEVQERGFNVLTWSVGELSYALVSDLGASELGTLRDILRGSASPG